MPGGKWLVDAHAWLIATGRISDKRVILIGFISRLYWYEMQGPCRLRILIHPHSCARHRNPADARLRGERGLFSPRTWAG
ncbi:hypothetical protein Agau_C200022 [Agrobacterium tumefaciens F2]|nr:hypothetical protein Agau_C200022 [Agrobacterium tumefaciens F2]